MVDLLQIELAFGFVSSQPCGTNEAYVSLDTGEVYFVSEFGDSDELPDGFEESDRYVRVPHKSELSLGRELVDEFVAAHTPHLADVVANLFVGRGAYARFKSLLARENLLDEWYSFENTRESEAIARWCLENQLPLKRDDPPASE